MSSENPYAVSSEHKNEEEHAKFIEKQRKFMIEEARKNDKFRNRLIGLAKEAEKLGIIWVHTFLKRHPQDFSITNL